SIELFDTHAHLHFPDFAPDLDDVLARARAAGVRRMVTIGTDGETSRAALAIAERDPDVWAVSPRVRRSSVRIALVTGSMAPTGAIVHARRARATKSGAGGTTIQPALTSAAATMPMTLAASAAPDHDHASAPRTAGVTATTAPQALSSRAT